MSASRQVDGQPGIGFGADGYVPESAISDLPVIARARTALDYFPYDAAIEPSPVSNTLSQEAELAARIAACDDPSGFVKRCYDEFPDTPWLFDILLSKRSEVGPYLAELCLTGLTLDTHTSPDEFLRYQRRLSLYEEWHLHHRQEDVPSAPPPESDTSTWHS